MNSVNVPKNPINFMIRHKQSCLVSHIHAILFWALEKVVFFGKKPEQNTNFDVSIILLQNMSRDLLVSHNTYYYFFSFVLLQINVLIFMQFSVLANVLNILLILNHILFGLIIFLGTVN